MPNNEEMGPTTSLGPRIYLNCKPRGKDYVAFGPFQPHAPVVSLPALGGGREHGRQVQRHEV